MVWPDLPIETDQDAVTDAILDGLAAALTGWVPQEGAPEVVLAEEIGRETVITRTRMQDMARLAIAGIGETVFGFPVRLGVAATIDVSVSVFNVGDVIPAGFTLIGTTADGVEVAFQLLTAVTTTTIPQTVTLTAALTGAVGNGVPSATALVVATSTATVVEPVTSVTASVGGSDAETITEYLTRFVDYVSVLRPGGVRGSDLAALARSVPGVWRAIGLDGYDALAATEDNERTATVFVVAADGSPVTVGIKADVYDVLEAVREPNFVLYVEDPTYTQITVAFTGTADAGADPATVQADVIAAVQTFISPATWGSTTDDPQAWLDRRVVRLLDVATVAGSVPGVASLVTLTLNGGTADITMTGYGPLPSPLTGVDPSSVTGTITAS
jgi:hypothetical protein